MYVSEKSSGSAVFCDPLRNLAAMAVILYYIEIPVVAFYKSWIRPRCRRFWRAFADGAAAGRGGGCHQICAYARQSTACVGEMADIIMSSCFIIPAS